MTWLEWFVAAIVVYLWAPVALILLLFVLFAIAVALEALKEWSKKRKDARREAR